MPIIASQHANDPWRPLHPWPDDCRVQWGGSGIVITDAGSYGTAFFEAFPGDGSAGFLRGEGETLEAAETDAFARYSRQRACHVAGGHAWTRARRLKGHEERLRKGRKVPKVDTYTNGGCFCLRCGAFQTAKPSIPRLGSWRDPMAFGELELIMMGSLGSERSRLRGRSERERAENAVFYRRLELRARMFGIALPDPAAPEYRSDEGGSILRESAYARDCRKAVVAFYAERRGTDAMEPEDGSGGGMFDFLTRRRLDREVEEMAARDPA
jgi:hypothetical protein